jgi:hypothetical protein
MLAFVSFFIFRRLDYLDLAEKENRGKGKKKNSSTNDARTYDSHRDQIKYRIYDTNPIGCVFVADDVVDDPK